MLKFCLTIIAVIMFGETIANEPTKYCITYDCNAQFVIGTKKIYRWTLDIGENSAVFYNNSYRGYNNKVADMRNSGDLDALLSNMDAIRLKYPNRNSLQLHIGSPTK